MTSSSFTLNFGSSCAPLECPQSSPVRAFQHSSAIAPHLSSNLKHRGHSFTTIFYLFQHVLTRLAIRSSLTPNSSLQDNQSLQHRKSFTWYYTHYKSLCNFSVHTTFSRSLRIKNFIISRVPLFTLSSLLRLKWPTFQYSSHREQLHFLASHPVSEWRNDYIVIQLPDDCPKWHVFQGNCRQRQLGSKTSIHCRNGHPQSIWILFSL